MILCCGPHLFALLETQPQALTTFVPPCKSGPLGPRLEALMRPLGPVVALIRG